MAPLEQDNDPEVAVIGSVERVEGTTAPTVVKLVGEIDLSNVEPLGLILDDVIDSIDGTDPQPLVLDLAALEFLDSSGIALLLRAASRVGSLEIRNPSTIIRRIIECTGLSDVLRIS